MTLRFYTLVLCHGHRPVRSQHSRCNSARPAAPPPRAGVTPIRFPA